MMTSFLITLEPLEPYFFGGEKNFDFGKNKRQIKQRYFIRSQLTPAQTTLLGALRYAVLAANNALITDFEDRDQRKRAAELIGENSFSFEKSCDFGVIGKIFPLFIKDGDSCIIPVPMNHNNKKEKEENTNTASEDSNEKSAPAPTQTNSKDNKVPEKYKPLKVIKVPELHSISSSDDLNLSSNDNLIFKDYDPKEGSGKGWFDLSNKTVKTEENLGEDEERLFEGVVRVGINSQRTESVRDDDIENYFKSMYA